MENIVMRRNRILTQEERDRIMAMYLNASKPKSEILRAKYYLTKEEREKYWTPKDYLENKEDIIAKHEAYYEKHKTEILKKAKVKFTCEICGSTCRRDGKSEHLKTKTHREASNKG